MNRFGPLENLTGIPFRQRLVENLTVYSKPNYGICPGCGSDDLYIDRHVTLTCRACGMDIARYD